MWLNTNRSPVNPNPKGVLKCNSALMSIDVHCGNLSKDASPKWIWVNPIKKENSWWKYFFQLMLNEVLKSCENDICWLMHSVHWGINPPLKTPPPLGQASPQICRMSKPPYILVFHEPFPQKMDFSYWFFVNPSPQKLIFQENPHNIFLPLTLSHILKVTKFFVKISQYCKFLVMTEKNIFVYKLFVVRYFRF